MKYRKVKFPDVPGWYWVRYRIVGYEWQCVCLRYLAGKLVIGNHAITDDWQDADWRGPIKPPKD